MARRGRVTTTSESETGRNTRFRDTQSGQSMSRAEFVKKIEDGKYANYHIRKINGVKTPASNPDKSEDNNLG